MELLTKLLGLKRSRADEPRVLKQFFLHEGSVTANPAMEHTSLVTITKSMDSKDDERQMAFDEKAVEQIKRRGDIVDVVSSTDGNHFHTVIAWVDDGTLGLITSFEYWDTGTEDEFGYPIMVYHDHKIMRNGDGFVLISNPAQGPEHSLSGDAVRAAIQDAMKGQTVSDEVIDELIKTIPEYRDNEGDSDMSEDTKTEVAKDEKSEAKAPAVIAPVVLIGKTAEHYNSLDDEGKAKFVTMSESERDAAVKAADAPTDEIEVAGMKFKKADDENGFKVAQLLKATMERVDAAEKTSAKAMAEKKAAELLPDLNIPAEQKNALVDWAMSQGDAGESILESLKNVNDVVSLSNTQLGHAGDVEGKTELAQKGITTADEADAELCRLAQKAIDEGAPQSKSDDGKTLMFEQVYANIKNMPENKSLKIMAAGY